jgi:hypothetical protein
MKKIKFYSNAKEYDLPEPSPSSKRIPGWYREQDGVINGMETIKKCIPVLDGFLSGYTITSHSDVFFNKNGVVSNSELSIVETHDKSQIANFNVPAEYNDQPFKWINYFTLKTPRGYSTLFIHPMNQIDLPFYSLGGIVDTDKHPVPVNFPFFIKKDFEGIIRGNTPIIQAIPFKREDWKMSLDEAKPGMVPIDFENSRLNPPFNYYKRKFWTRKKFN